MSKNQQNQIIKEPTFDIRGLTIPQREIFLAGKENRFRVVVAGRRFGKTCLSITEVIYEAQRGYKRLVWYVAPTYRMAKNLVWDELKDAIPKENIIKSNEAELSIVLKGCHSKIELKGADNPDSLRGKGLDFIVMDEAGDQSPEAWFEVIYPALTDKQGSALFIGTPKGYNWFYDLYQFGKTQPLWKSFTYTTEQGGNVPKAELEYARATMSPKQYAQEFLASFETLTNNVYHCFSRLYNTDPHIEDLGREIHIGMDFNVNPMSAVIGQIYNNQLHIFDEIVIDNGDTQQMAEEIYNRYKGRKIIIYPDPSGRSRKTSAVGQTDFSILQKYGYQIVAPKKAPPVVDRVNVMNALFRNAVSERRAFINDRCKNTIKCLEGLTYKKGTSIIDKDGKLDHLPDAMGYLAIAKFPIVKLEHQKFKLQGL